MSLDISIVARDYTDRTICLYSGNITHNLIPMAKAAGLFEYLWRPEELPDNTTHAIISDFRKKLEYMKANPEEFSKFDVENGWGTYHDFVAFLSEFADACFFFPDGKIESMR